MEAKTRPKMNQQLPKNKTRRKPLSDCTNTNTNTNITSSQSSTSSSIIKPNPTTNNITTGSSLIYQNATNPTSALSTPQKSLSVTTGIGGGDDDEVIERSVYTRRQSAVKRNGKGKAVAEPLSYSTAAAAAAESRIPTFRNKINEDGEISLAKLCTVPYKKKSNLSRDKIKEDEDISLSKSCIVPHKKKRRIPLDQDDSKYSLPQDFVEQQRAYFKEIDEFDLPEEEVASGDELE